jgi:hypothetical protein
MRNDAGDKVVDWLMDIALDERLPAWARKQARDKLRACALRQPGQTVQDVIGEKH